MKAHGWSDSPGNKVERYSQVTKDKVVFEIQQTTGVKGDRFLSNTSCLERLHN